MSTSPSLPRRMRLQLPENGYESPVSEDERASPPEGTKNAKQRNGFASGTAEAQRTRSESHTSGTTRGDQQSQDERSQDEQLGDGGEEKIVTFRDRIGQFTWTWFTLTMATGGIANVLHSIPYRSEWLKIIGIIVFLFNLLLFVAVCICITLRFKWNPGSFKGALLSQSESLFIPAFVVSIGTILVNLCQYGIPAAGPWFQTAMQVCLWLYVALAIIASAGIYLTIWSTQSFPLSQMTPIWIFPAYPLLLVAPIASQLINALPDAAAAARVNAIAMAFGAVCLQGIGFLVSLMIYSAFIYRLMTQKLPRETTRPGMFVSVGPSGFTVAGIVTLGSTVMPKIMPHGFMGEERAGFFLKLMANMTGLSLWGLCLWFFIVSVGAHWQLTQPGPEHHIGFDMTWYSFVFPNTAMVTATTAIGKAFDSDAIKIVGTVLAAILVVVWIVVFMLMIRALWQRKILWPGSLDGSAALTERWKHRFKRAQTALQRDENV